MEQWYYISAAAFVSVLAFLWGDTKKVFGAGVLLVSIFLSNIALVLFGFFYLSTHQMILAYSVMDTTIAVLLYRIFKSGSFIISARWAGAACVLHLLMIGTHLILISTEFLSIEQYVALLNFLMFVTISILILGFVPKNFDEAYQILKLKLLYLKVDLSRFFNIPADVKRLWYVTLVHPDEAKEIQKRIGERLRHARLEKRLTSTKVAKLLNVEQSTLSRIENGERRIGAADLVALAKFYELEIDTLFEGIDIATGQLKVQS